MLLAVVSLLSSQSTHALTEEFFAFPGYESWKTFCVLICLGMALRGLRWLLLFSNGLNEGGTKIFLYHGWFLVLSMLSAFRSGEVLRIVWLQSNGLSLGAATTRAIAEKLCDAAFLVLALAFLSMVEFSHNIVSLGTSLLLASVATLSFVLIFSRLYKSRGRLLKNSKGPISARLQKLSRNVHSHVEEMQENTGVSAYGNSKVFLFITTSAIWLAVIAAFTTLIGFNFSTVPLMTTAIMVILINILGFINVFPANIGPFEATVIGALVANEVEMGDAAAFAFSVHFLVIVSTIAYGVACRFVIFVQRGLNVLSDG